MKKANLVRHRSRLPLAVLLLGLFPLVSQAADRSGKEVVDTVCIACHGPGKDGAPKIGDIDAWKPRLQNGVAPLVNSAIGGHKGMPARGGMASLSDAEIRAAVNCMVGQTAGAAVKQH